jgi:polyferredoxin
MAKVGRPSGLIAYDTDVNIHRRLEHEEPIYRIVRPRTVLYAALIAVVGGLMLYALATRTTVGLNVLHDRNPVFVRLADGSIRNAYTVRIINKTLEEAPFRLEIIGIPSARLEIVGENGGGEQSTTVSVGPDQTSELRALVTVPKGDDQPTRNIRFRLTNVATGQDVSTDDFFRGTGGTP